MNCNIMITTVCVQDRLCAYLSWGFEIHEQNEAFVSSRPLEERVALTGTQEQSASEGQDCNKPINNPKAYKRAFKETAELASSCSWISNAHGR